MRHWKHRIKYMLSATVAASLLGMGTLYAADEPTELNADTVEYDMASGLATATGNVLLKRGNARATGRKASYNVKTQEALLEGNVIAEREKLRITCEKVQSDGKGHMQADGNVYGKQEDKTFIGEHVDYYPDDRKHVVIPLGGVVTSKDGTATADHMEGWMDDEHYIGTGNAHLVSPPRNLEAGGDRIDYYGKEQRVAILTGNAWAYQNNNSMKGNRVTVYLADEGKSAAQPKPAEQQQ